MDAVAASPAKAMHLQSVRGAGVCRCVLRLRCLFQWIDHEFEFGGWDWQCALQKKYMLRDDKRRTISTAQFIHRQLLP